MPPSPRKDKPLRKAPPPFQARKKSTTGSSATAPLNKRALKSLREDQQSLLLALEAAGVASWEWNIGTDEVRWSANAFKLFGQVSRRALGKTFGAYLALLPEDDRAKILKAIQHAVAEGEDYHFEHRMIKADGSIGWFEVTGKIFRNKRHVPTKARGTFQEITAKKSREESRDDWRVRQDLISSSAGLVLYDYTIPTGDILWSGNLEEVLGYSEEELGDVAQWELRIHPEDRAMASKELKKGQKTLKPYDMYYRFQTKRGVYRYLHDRGFFIPDTKGRAYRMLGMMTDVSERLAAEDLLRQSEQSYRELFDTVGEAIYIQNPDGTFVDVNQGACRMYGYSKAEFIGRKPDFLSAEGKNDFAVLEKLTQKSLAGKPQSFEWWGKKKNGEIFLKEVRLTKGSYFGKEIIIVTAWDITGRREAEKALQESEKRFRNLIRDLNVGVILQGGHSEILMANHFALHLLGLQEAQVLGQTTLDLAVHFINEDGTPCASEFYPTAAAQTKSPVRGRVMGIYRQRVEESVWVLVNAAPMWRDTGELMHVVITFTDITERRNIEERLKESEFRFRTLQQASFGGIGLHDQGVILDCNQGLSDITGFSHEELIGKDGLELIAPAWRGFVMEQIRSGTEKSYDVEGLHKNGTRYALEIHAKNLPYKGKTIRVAEFRDITERKLAEETILAQNARLTSIAEDLKQKNEQMEEFTQIVSHNLRSPVGNILTLLNFFENAETETEKAEYLSLLKESGTTTLTTLHELNEVLQIKQNKNVEKQLIHFDKAFSHVKSMLNAIILETNAEIISDFTAMPTIEYPNIYLESILLNLLSNALKYHHPDRRPVIKVKTFYHQHQPILEISDNGRGINLTRYGHQVFKLRKTFHKHSESRGIGLFMIKNQIEAMGGDITLTSQENEGSTFTITFTKP